MVVFSIVGLALQHIFFMFSALVLGGLIDIVQTGRETTTWTTSTLFIIVYVIVQIYL